jgi:tetratricopeptide (TPR) repeat protein
MESSGEKNEFRFVCAALLIGTFAAYCVVLSAGFINYDDIDYVTDNYHVKNGLTPGGIYWAFTTGFASNWHPLTWISLMLDAQFYGRHAGGFHLTNLLLHMANAVLLLAVLKKMSGALWRSACVAALFAWHPLHVESVAWIAERKDVLSGFFWLLTMLFYLRYVEASSNKSAEKKKWYGLTLLFFVCGLLSKPMVVTLPFVLLLVDCWPLRRIAGCGARSGEPGEAAAALPLSRVVREKIPFFALALISSVITFAVQKSGGAMAALEHIPMKQRIPNALVSYVLYLRKMFWPPDLAVFYPFNHHLPAWQWAGAAILLGLISALAIALLKKLPYVAIGWFWYLGTLVPVIGLVQVGEQALADRYTYLPLVGIFIVLAWGAADLTEGWPGRRAILKSGATAVLGACIFLTVTQAGYWKNSVALFTHAANVTKNNSLAHVNLGAAYDKLGLVDKAKAEFNTALQIDPDSSGTLNGLGELYEHGGNPAKAIDYFNSALRKRPFYGDAHYNLGNVLAAEGNYAEAAEHYAAAIHVKPDSADAYNNLAAMDMRLGKVNEALNEFGTALEIQPDFPEAHVQLADLLVDMGHPEAAWPHYLEAMRLKPGIVHGNVRFGLLLGRKGELDAAISQFLDAIKLQPTNVTVYYNLGAAYAAENKLDAAAENFAHAAKLAPNDADLQGRLAATLAVAGKSEEAVKAYREALQLKPDWAPAMRDLAWLLATCPKAAVRNGEEAVKLAERANALMPKPDPGFLEALDAAYAEAGRFDDAIKTAEKVRQLALAAQQQNVVDHAAQRIALYKAGKPYHEAAH